MVRQLYCGQLKTYLCCVYACYVAQLWWVLFIQAHKQQIDEQNWIW